MKHLYFILILITAIVLQSCEKDLFKSYKNQVSTSNEDAKNISIDIENEDYTLYLNGSIPASFITGDESVIIYAADNKHEAETFNFNSHYIIPQSEYDTSFSISIFSVCNEMNEDFYTNDTIYFRLLIKDDSDIGYASNIIAYSKDLLVSAPLVTVPCESSLYDDDFESVSTIPGKTLNFYKTNYMSENNMFKIELQLRDDFYYSYDYEDMVFEFYYQPQNGVYTTVSSESELDANTVLVYTTSYYGDPLHYAIEGCSIYVNNNDQTKETTISTCELTMEQCFDINNLQIRGRFTD
ncbi:MAG: hypothetical protein PF481_03690 [Bacteroidales bacterium]|jgi:hypothetical protein|nr:hypothetical protein [Bacteroidales bacterium]